MTTERPKIIGNIPKLPAKFVGWVMPFFLSCLMSGIISFINMLRNLGWSDTFLSLWFSAWMMSWAIAYPVVLVMLPLVRKLTGLLVEMPPNQPPK
ncbi:DUF2798 domain-containing protein [Acinetobacter tandoii]|jgi:hypothetical protein|uniref:DUF2798 domain-containing protein n=2 Tax=Acinetobacter tandoii TaxID=202954 RepID=A0A5N4W1C3_9GAMM|nr:MULTISPECIES: DUF2798 domain-containing protein [Acinetobacter]KAB1851877.1 DUF2798 domain-containing protein [Acinetobacter tandoii]UOG17475.1 DUF2798 domain-containing protein [Acinetobacter sp. PK01]